ncbi:MAG: outer membrane protein assembly factor BamA [Candidatus Marinimicrobia bacterium]|nr:outer membrane protein assembly factor BamA [Candidatus Neomarinimicrobiota bacterium]
MKRVFYKLSAIKILLIILSTYSAGFAQEKIQIFSVDVEGNKSASSNVIIRNSGLSPGKSISGDDIRDAISKLWAMKIFSDVQILAEKQVEEGIYLLIKVEEYLKIDKYELKGNKEIKDDKLEEVVTFFRGQRITPHMEMRTIRAIKDLYKEKGFLLAEISTERIPSEKEDYIILRFNIKEGSKVKIRGISVSGVENFSEGKIKKQMKKTKEKGKLRFWRKGNFDKDEYEEDKKNIVQFYQDNGYRDAEIVSDSLYYDDNLEKLFIDITVNEGMHYKLGKLTFEGNQLFDDDELSRALGLTEGDDYSEKELDLAVYESLTGIYMDRGYIYVNIQPVQIPSAEDVVDIEFSIQENQKVFVRNVNIYGNTKTKEKVIRREMKIFPGEVFSRTKLIRSQREVWILNYFANVIPNIRPVDDDEIDIEISVEEKQTDRANASAGFSQRDGAIGSIGVDFNNFIGNGQVLSFNWQFGRVYRALSIGFTEPWLFDTPTLAGFRVFSTKRRGVFFPLDQKEIGGSISLGRRFKWPDDYFRGNTSLRIAERQFDNISDRSILERLISKAEADKISDDEIGDKVIKTHQRSITTAISRDSRDRPEFPTQGSVFTLVSQVSGGPLGGNEDFYKNTITVDWYTPVFWKFVLFSKYKYGAIGTFKKNAFIPWDEYFFMGGSGLTIGEPLRGYDDRTVGPPSPTSSNFALGARVLAKFSIELRFPIAPNPTIFGLFFYEGGNTWLDMKSTDVFDLRKSAGFGLRMFMPLVGLIGFDMGYGFDDLTIPGEREGWKVHFQFGRQF